MKIKKEYKFYAGHRNADLADKCYRPHGHDYRIFCVFDVVRNGSITTLFGDFDSKIEPWLKNEFDHRFLIDKNDPLKKYFDLYEKEEGKDLGYKELPFATSVENLCYFIFKHIKEEFGFDISELQIQETRTSTVIYTLDDYQQDSIILK